MEIWQAIVLGAVQGLTEFLPVSSSGHLMLMQNWFGISENTMFYSVMLHIGTLIPVIIVLWKQIVGLFKKPLNTLGCLVLATIPAGIVGLLVGLFLDIDKFFSENIWLLSITFVLTAAELFFSELYTKRRQLSNGINVKTSFIMGCGQALGTISGLSRSGTVISSGTLAKVSTEHNATFTFLMSIPITLCAVGWETVRVIKDGLGTIQALPLILGVITAMIFGYIAVKFMLKIIKKANYKWFSLYLVLLAIANVIVYAVR